MRCFFSLKCYYNLKKSTVPNDPVVLLQFAWDLQGSLATKTHYRQKKIRGGGALLILTSSLPRPNKRSCMKPCYWSLTHTRNGQKSLKCLPQLLPKPLNYSGACSPCMAYRIMSSLTPAHNLALQNSKRSWNRTGSDTSSVPYNPPANGAVERMVQAFKQAMKAGEHDGLTLQHCLSYFLLTYRTTPTPRPVYHQAHCSCPGLFARGWIYWDLT